MKAVLQSLFGIVLFGVLVSFIIQCSRKDHANEVFTDIRAQVVMMNNEQGEDGSKTHSPTMVKSVLFRKLGENYFFEMNNKDNPSVITDEWFYNHFSGDTVHFDYVRKDRFFVINRRPPTGKSSTWEDTLTREQRLFGK